jgi:hypothetical protein
MSAGWERYQSWMIGRESARIEAAAAVAASEFPEVAYIRVSVERNSDDELGLFCRIMLKQKPVTSHGETLVSRESGEMLRDFAWRVRKRLESLIEPESLGLEMYDNFRALPEQETLRQHLARGRAASKADLEKWDPPAELQNQASDGQAGECTGGCRWKYIALVDNVDNVQVRLEQCKRCKRVRAEIV